MINEIIFKKKKPLDNSRTLIAYKKENHSNLRWSTIKYIVVWSENDGGNTRAFMYIQIYIYIKIILQPSNRIGDMRAG